MVPYVIAYMPTFISMGLYFLIGKDRGDGYDGSLVKFLILYYSRFVGILAHLAVVILGSSFYLEDSLNTDYLFFALNPLIAAYLEYHYWLHGNKAM